MAINPSIPLSGKPLNAFANYMQGVQARELKDARGRRNTLAQNLPQAMTGDQEALGVVSGASPEMGMQVMQYVSKLDEAQRKRAAELTERVGKTAGDFLSLPPDQQQQMFPAYASALSEAGLSDVPSPVKGYDAFRQYAAQQAAEAGILGEALSREAPQVRNIREGKDVVNVQWNPQSGKYEEIGRGPVSGGVTFNMGGLMPGQASVGTPEPDEGQGLDLSKAVREGTGPAAYLQNLWNNVRGPFMEGQPFPDVAQAKATLNLFNQELKRSLMVGSRGAVWEQQIIQRDILPDPNKFLTDPDGELAKLEQVRKTLEQVKRENRKAMERGGITKDKYGALADENAQIDRLLSMMGTVGGGQDAGIGAMGLEELQSLDPSQLSEEELQQAKDRWEQLNAQ